MMKESNPNTPKYFSLGISLKLFIAFWLVILSSVLISYLVTMQFKHSPTQEQVDTQQLSLLSHYQKELKNRVPTTLQALQREFYKDNEQYLIIKNFSTHKIYTPKRRPWLKVKHYLRKYSLDNPVTIDFGFTEITASQPITLNNQRVQLFIASKVPPRFLMGLIKQLPIAIRFLVLLAISFALCWLLAKSFTNPLIAIKKASEDIGQGRLSTRIDNFDKRSDEFGALARSFNQMAEQLENNISAHQRLLGDVSHELRSPLTRLQLAVALAEKNMGNTEEQQKHLTRCELEVDRLDEMIADVLTLSRLEHGQNSFKTENTDLNKLVDHVINDCQYFANSKNVTINRKGAVSCNIAADSKLLISAISNVVNNAVKYSPENNDVKVSLNDENEQIVLTISDQGTGVPEHMLTKLFSPFFRVADGRERRSGGTGLGLAITQQAIGLHHGEVYAQNQEPHGLKVTIKLPIINI